MRGSQSPVYTLYLTLNYYTGWSTTGVNETRDKPVTYDDASWGHAPPLPMPRAAASDGAAACCPGAAVRRSYRSAAAASSPSSLRDPNSDAVVHPPTSIEYELYRRSLMAAKA